MKMRPPTDEEAKDLAQYTEEQLTYWDDIRAKHKTLPKDTMIMAGFFKGILADVREKFPKSRLLRDVLHEYAKRLERLGTYKLEDTDPKIRSDLLLHAANLYQEADEIWGYLSDNGFRQMECYAGAIHFRREAGLENEIEQLGLAERKSALVKAVFGREPDAVISREQAKELFGYAEQTVDDTVKVYVVNIEEKDNQNSGG